MIAATIKENKEKLEAFENKTPEQVIANNLKDKKMKAKIEMIFSYSLSSIGKPNASTNTPISEFSSLKGPFLMDINEKDLENIKAYGMEANKNKRRLLVLVRLNCQSSAPFKDKNISQLLGQSQSYWNFSFNPLMEYLSPEKKIGYFKKPLIEMLQGQDYTSLRLYKEANDLDGCRKNALLEFLRKDNNTKGWPSAKEEENQKLSQVILEKEGFKTAVFGEKNEDPKLGMDQIVA